MIVTRLAAVPLIINMLVAIVSTKIIVASSNSVVAATVPVMHAEDPAERDALLARLSSPELGNVGSR